MTVTNKLSTKANPFLLDDIFRFSKGKYLARFLKSSLEYITGLSYLAKEYESLDPTRSAREFVQQSFKKLNVNYKIVSGSLEDVPASGPAIVVANHPFGGMEGMLMVELLLQRRSDVKIIANNFLKRVPELSDMFIGVNPYGHKEATRQNFSAMREGIRWLKQGGLLVMFPAGDVSSIQLKNLSIVDGQWDASVSRMARLGSACVLPMHIGGYNSAGFYMASLLHPLLKTLLLPRQLINKRGSTINLSVGKRIENNRLAKLSSDEEGAAYLRLRTYLLSQQQLPAEEKVQRVADVSIDSEYQQIIGPLDTELLTAEIRHLPNEQLLTEAGKFQVYYARAKQIPWVLQEIGRLREISFRTVGEGTGKDLDIDLFDSFYLHLFVWNNDAREVVGGYRLGLADEIVDKYGMSGLYSYSLFKYSRSFVNRINPAVELGRSFVRPEYQRNFTPLMLLWKGIGRFVAAHPRYAVLFGPVSISNEYSSMSQQLLIEFLRLNMFDMALGRKVRPRSPYRQRPFQRLRSPQVDGLKSIEDVSALVADIESDDKGVPVLIRQYLKLGGRMLGFNIDAQFSDVVDGLIRVDLRETDPRILQKYMGREEAQAFINYHGEISRKAG
jgi:putative hemolysin